jgi:hypothetical protein
VLLPRPRVGVAMTWLTKPNINPNIEMNNAFSKFVDFFESFFFLEFPGLRHPTHPPPPPPPGKPKPHSPLKSLLPVHVLRMYNTEPNLANFLSGFFCWVIGACVFPVSKQNKN